MHFHTQSTQKEIQIVWVEQRNPKELLKMRQPSPKHGQKNRQWGKKIKQKSENGTKTIKVGLNVKKKGRQL